MAELSQYEKERKARMQMNASELSKIGIRTLADALAVEARNAKAARRIAHPPQSERTHEPLRRSGRLAGTEVGSLAEDALVEPFERRGGRRQLGVGGGHRRRRTSSDLPERVYYGIETYTKKHFDALGTCKTPLNWVRGALDPSGETCHQCRQKTADRKTRCTKCQEIRGQFCGMCLQLRYGENLEEVMAKVDAGEEWECPVCRDICNCSICRTRKGWPPTGILAPYVGDSPSVAHFLVNKFLVDDNGAPLGDCAKAAAAESDSEGDSDGKETEDETETDAESETEKFDSEPLNASAESLVDEPDRTENTSPVRVRPFVVTVVPMELNRGDALNTSVSSCDDEDDGNKENAKATQQVTASSPVHPEKPESKEKAAATEARKAAVVMKTTTMATKAVPTTKATATRAEKKRVLPKRQCHGKNRPEVIVDEDDIRYTPAKKARKTAKAKVSEAEFEVETVETETIWCQFTNYTFEHCTALLCSLMWMRADEVSLGAFNCSKKWGVLILERQN